MKLEVLQTAIDETERFFHTALLAKREISENKKRWDKYHKDKAYVPREGNKAQAACKRASMDLSRALTELRK